MQLEEINGWSLRGKTGSGFQQDETGQKDLKRKLGWFMGWIEKGERAIAFVYLGKYENEQEGPASRMAKTSALQLLDKFIDD